MKLSEQKHKIRSLLGTELEDQWDNEKRGGQQYWKSTHTDVGTFCPFSFTCHNKANQFTIILVNRTQKFTEKL
jgi:hypothetical protein